tara:strand:+ start:150 stop:875 length:726 start_codon:yes stop_codon:yes gene_type:complete
MQHFNLSDSVETYITNTNAKLTIKSVVTDLTVEFPAFLTDFSQTFDATWNTEDVFGRMDPIATYQGTKRTMSLGFDLPAGSLEAAKTNLARCSELVKMVYPVYINRVLSKPPLVRIRFANLIRGRLLIDKEGTLTDITERNLGEVVNGKTKIEGGTGQIIEFSQEEKEGIEILSTVPVSDDKFGMLLGWISGLSWKPNLEMGMFTTGEEFYPKVISLSFSYNILHEQTLSQDSPKIGSFPF